MESQKQATGNNRGAATGGRGAAGHLAHSETAMKGGSDVSIRRFALPVLISLVSLSGLVLTMLAIVQWSGEPIWALLILACLAATAERFDLSLYGDGRVSVSFVLMFSAVFLGGLPGLIVVVPAAVIASAVGARRPPHKVLFNFGTLMLAGAASALVIYAWSWVADTSRWLMIGPAILGAGAHFLVNALLVALVIALSSGLTVRAVWKENFTWLWPHYLILGVFAFAIASAYSSLGLFGIAVFVIPPVMMRLSLKQYLDRTTQGVLELREAHVGLQQAHEDLNSAYDGTLRSLVAALDARDSETGGHSSRVAELTAAIAEEMGISRDSEAGRIIAWGALLHDVGKIAVPDAILRKPSKLSDEEWVTMRTHARAGYEIVQSVKFLAPAAEIVLAHHERWDGGGYPRGLGGEEIPLGARIFMIADTFDAITSERPYKAAIPAEEALAEILRNSGTQFDPAAVKAFLRVYEARFVGSGRSRPSARQLSGSIKEVLAEAASRLEAN